MRTLLIVFAHFTVATAQNIPLCKPVAPFPPGSATLLRARLCRRGLALSLYFIRRYATINTPEKKRQWFNLSLSFSWLHRADDASVPPVS